MFNWLFSKVWRKWLFDYRGRSKKVVKVCSWRSALVDDYSGGRQRITVCFWWLK